MTEDLWAQMLAALAYRETRILIGDFDKAFERKEVPHLIHDPDIRKRAQRVTNLLTAADQAYMATQRPEDRQNEIEKKSFITFSICSRSFGVSFGCEHYNCGREYYLNFGFLHFSIYSHRFWNTLIYGGRNGNC